MDDVLAAALARIFEQDEDLARQVFENPPESIADLPAVVMVDSQGDTGRAGYGVLWEAVVTMRVLLLAAARGRNSLAEEVRPARPWVGRVLNLLAAHDELVIADDSVEEVGEIQRMRWKMAEIGYGGMMYVGVEFEIDVRVDWQVIADCGRVGSYAAP